MQGGGKVLRRMGLRVEALAAVERIEDGRIIWPTTEHFKFPAQTGCPAGIPFNAI